MYYEKLICLPSDLYHKEATLYLPEEGKILAFILYFHGGGLLYGSREDLPSSHIEAFTKAGLGIIAFDYPLAPSATLEIILRDAADSVRLYTENALPGIDCTLPFFLFGRSAGAYLCLLGAAKSVSSSVSNSCGSGANEGEFEADRFAPFGKAAGILSFYGYGFLCNNWFEIPSPHYLRLPPVPDPAADQPPSSIRALAPLEAYYHIYVYARQKGLWRKLLYPGKHSVFLSSYSLRSTERLPSPLFCAHSIQDPDVPYEEFLALCEKYNASRYVCASSAHDFDRTESGFLRKMLLEATLKFIREQLS